MATDQEKQIQIEKEIKKARYHQTLKAFSYNFLGTILPLIISILPIGVLSTWHKIYSFLDEGEILLFSAGLFTSSIYVYGENKDLATKSLDKFLYNSSFWLLIISSSFYAILYCLQILNITSMQQNLYFIRWSSIVLFLLSIIAIYRGLFLESKKVYREINPIQQSQQGVNNIMDKL